MAVQTCADIYNRPFVFDHGDVIFTTPDNLKADIRTGASGSNSITTYSDTFDSRYFPLRSNPIWNLSIALPLPRVSLIGNLTTYHNVTSCYSDMTVAHCKLNINIVILAIVVTCNIIKAICMFVTVCRSKDYPLVTIGDAIASFLEHPDTTTQNLCLLSKTSVDQMWGKLSRPMKWRSAAEKGMYSVSPRRWANINLM